MGKKSKASRSRPQWHLSQEAPSRHASLIKKYSQDEDFITGSGAIAGFDLVSGSISLKIMRRTLGSVLAWGRAQA
jgi:hypothetical protein